MTKPLVSISIPVYNQELYLRQCLDSVLAQIYEHWECVLVDDGSTDASGKICDEYAKKDNRFKVVHKKNAGLAAARQTGLENLSGKYVVNIDSDDWVDPEHVENMVNAAEENQADIVICPYYQNVGEKQLFVECKPSAFDKETLQNEVLEGKYHAGVVLKLLARKLFTEYPIKPAPYNHYEDMYTYISCLQYAKKVIYIPIATYHYRYNEQSMTHDRDVNKRIMMFEQCMNNLLAIQELSQYGNDDDFIKAIYHRANHEKAQLLGNASHYSAKRPYLMKYFPDSPSIIKITDFRAWGLKSALNGNVLPYFLFKVYHFSGRKIREFFLTKQ